MNISNYSANANFKGLNINPEGLNKIEKESNRFIQKFIETAEKAKASKENNLIVDERGRILIENEKYGKFLTNNPPQEKAVGKVFQCDIRDAKTDKIKRLSLEMPSESEARRLEDKFGPGTYVPESRLDLFNAMEVASAYKKSLIQKLKSL